MLRFQRRTWYRSAQQCFGESYFVSWVTILMLSKADSKLPDVGSIKINVIRYLPFCLDNCCYAFVNFETNPI
ncbi:hypothetical protein ASC93_10870 [Massilia sp. Root335]|nr:hypothetical protein ASC93_10870 [Massilia sp. Root335]